MTAPRLTWAVLCATLALSACHAQKRGIVPSPSTSPENACLALVERCELTGTAADCDGADACIGLWERASLEWSWRRELEALAGVDAAVAAGQLSDALGRVAELETQRWYWLVGGGAAGVLGAVILVLAL